MDLLLFCGNLELRNQDDSGGPVGGVSAGAEDGVVVGAEVGTICGCMGIVEWWCKCAGCGCVDSADQRRSCGAGAGLVLGLLLLTAADAANGDDFLLSGLRISSTENENARLVTGQVCGFSAPTVAASTPGDSGDIGLRGLERGL